MSTHLDNTYGAAFTGMVVAAALYGVSCVQTLYYFTSQNDPWYIKLTVATVMIFDTLHQIFITHTLYTYTITDWGDLHQLQFIIWSLLVEVIFSGLTAFIVQSFLALRIWLLSGRNIFITGTSAILVLGGIVSHFVYVAKAFQIKTLVDLSEIKVESIAVNILGAAADLLIAATLCALLNFSRTGFRKSNAMINRLIFFSVNTGLLTSLCALASLISILVAGDTYIYIAFFFCLSRLYTNSLLATLNVRDMIRGAGKGARAGEGMSVSLRDFRNSESISGGQRRDLSIKIDTIHEYHPDNDRKIDEESAGVPSPLPYP